MPTLSTPPNSFGEGDLTPGRPVSGSRVRLRQRTATDTLAQPWILELAPEAEAFVEPLDGWIGVRVRIGGAQLDFATRSDAETFAARQGWIVEPVDPPGTGTTH